MFVLIYLKISLNRIIFFIFKYYIYKKNKKIIFFFIHAGKEFCKKVEVYYCELCKFNLPPHNDVEQQLGLHCRNRVHLQRYVQHCEKTKSREKPTEKITKQSTDDTKSDSESSNKV